MRLAIIGAGVAGLSAAYYLRHMPATGPRLDVTVYEKEEEVGGRATTRHEHGCTFDYGAQYFKTETPAVEQLVLTELPRDALLDIGRDVWTFDHEGTILPGDEEQNRAPKWTYLDGLVRLSRHLSRGVEVRTEARIGRLAKRPDGRAGYQLHSTQGRPVGEADMVLLAIPAPQAAELINRSDIDGPARTSLSTALAGATYNPCLSLALGYDRPPTDLPYYALVNSDKQHDISWIAFEHLKGADRVPSSQTLLIVQMGPRYSRVHYEEPATTVAPAVAAMVSSILGEDFATPAWSDLERWRYALPDRLIDMQSVQNVAPHLFLAGDYLRGPRIHLAMESGLAAGARIAAHSAPTTR